jgi:biotin synthase-like enzyme
MSNPEVLEASEVKYREIDTTIKMVDKQLKEGSILDRGERGRNKVAALASSTFGKKTDDDGKDNAQKAGLILTSQGISENCHFCKQRVYLMEKINVEGLVLHRSCLKCNHCSNNLRLGKFF